MSLFTMQTSTSEKANQKSPEEQVARDTGLHRHTFSPDGHLTVTNLSAFWIPELTTRDVIRGTAYIVTGSYDGDETFVRSLEQIAAHDLSVISDENGESGLTIQAPKDTKLLQEAEEKADDSGEKS